MAQTRSFSQIIYSAGACFGTCPVYRITVNADHDHTAVFEAKRFNFSDDFQENEGTFTTAIDDEHYNELIALLIKANPKKMQDNYGNKRITDLPTSYLTLHYSDDTVKKIRDYGKAGTQELAAIYQFFDELRTNQKWTRTDDLK